MTSTSPRQCSIGDVARRTGVSERTLRYYEELVSLASVMGPARCHEHGTTWRCQ